jgi:hypothetical protein
LVNWIVEIGDQSEPELDAPAEKAGPQLQGSRQANMKEQASVQRRRIASGLCLDPKRKAILLVSGAAAKSDSIAS